jgi:hypothetical protein
LGEKFPQVLGAGFVDSNLLEPLHGGIAFAAQDRQSDRAAGDAQIGENLNF